MTDQPLAARISALPDPEPPYPDWVPEPYRDAPFAELRANLQ
jgi:hypothetical protein